MPVTATEVLVTLRRPPQNVFSGVRVKRGPANHFRFRLGPDFEIALGAEVRGPGEAGDSRTVELFACRETQEYLEPYDRLLADALTGDPRLFAREDEVEAAWRMVDPVLTDPPLVHEYAPGSWGPDEAHRIIGHGGWHVPR